MLQGELARIDSHASADEMPDIRSLEKRLSALWLVTVVVIFALTGALTSIVFALLRTVPESAWPWETTELVLLCGNIVMIVCLIVYLNGEQKSLRSERAAVRDFERRAQELNQRRVVAMFEVSRTMGVQTSIQIIFDCITKACEAAFSCSQVSLMLFDEESLELEVRSASGHPDVSKVIGSRQKIGDGIAGWAAEHREALLLGHQSDEGQYPDLELRSPSLMAAMVVPIIVRDELVGVLNVSSRQAGLKYTNEDLSALRVFAENAGASIRHAEQTVWMRQTIEQLRGKLGQVGSTLREV